MADRDMSELVESYIDKNRLYHMEGDSGLDKFEKLLEVIGYRGHNFQHGSPIEEFLSDNPGAVEALVSFISDQNSSEWRENLEAALPAADEIDEEECEIEEFMANHEED